ncbi:hypothetical protein ES707_16204 [subsurface metagenome]
MEKIDPKTTALVIIDPQNDFLSENSVVWDLVGDLVVKNRVVDKLFALFNCLNLISNHYRKESVLGRLNHTPVLLWLCIRGMGKEDYIERHIYYLPL